MNKSFKDIIKDELYNTWLKMSSKEGLPKNLIKKDEIEVSVPKYEEHGDFTSNIAFLISKRSKEYFNK